MCRHYLKTAWKCVCNIVYKTFTLFPVTSNTALRSLKSLALIESLTHSAIGQIANIII